MSDELKRERIRIGEPEIGKSERLTEELLKLNRDGATDLDDAQIKEIIENPTPDHPWREIPTTED